MKKTIMTIALHVVSLTVRITGRCRRAGAAPTLGSAVRDGPSYNIARDAPAMNR